MSTNLTCEHVLLAQADFDGELDAAEAAVAQAHRESCPTCAAAYADFARVRESLRTGGLYAPAPEELRRTLAPRPESTQGNGWVRTAASFGLGAALAAGIAFAIVRPAEPELMSQIVSGHVRALQPGHLMDVVSTDRHTVKPWFDGRLDFAPPVKDLAAQGFPLEGGRLDYLAGRPVAALVYGRDKHQINLFLWPEPHGNERPRVGQQQGYNVVHTNQGGMALWAVSDLEESQLAAFVALWKAAP